MRISIKREIIVSLFVLCIVSCQKSTDSKMSDFVTAYRNSFASVQHTNPYILSSTAEKTLDKEITINLLTKSTDATEMESDLIRKSLPDIIKTAILNEAAGKELVNDGVKFNVKILNETGQNVLYSKVFDKTSAGQSVSPASLQTPSGINQILDSFNKNLPMTDPSTGIKIVKIEAGNDHDLIYHAVVPPTMAELFKTDGAKDLLRDELLRNPQVRQILMKSESFGITKLKYRYNDEKEKLITEVAITNADLK